MQPQSGRAARHFTLPQPRGLALKPAAACKPGLPNARARVKLAPARPLRWPASGMGAGHRMTALAQYRRLEAVGQWRESEGAPPREVIVSFGQATLVFSDPGSEAPLTHWSLPAIINLTPAPGVNVGITNDAYRQRRVKCSLRRDRQVIIA